MLTRRIVFLWILIVVVVCVVAAVPSYDIALGVVGSVALGLWVLSDHGQMRRDYGDHLVGSDAIGWVAGTILLCIVALPVYLLRRRRIRQQNPLPRPTASGSGPVDTTEALAKLASLHERGVLSDQEFAMQKARLLA